MPLLQLIENTLDELPQKINWSDVANAAGVTKSTLSHAKNGGEIKFPTQLRIIKNIYKDQHTHIFKNLCLEFKQPKNIKYSLEFLSSNKHIKELELLLKDIEGKSGLSDWFEGYTIALKYLKGENPNAVLEMIRVFKTKSPEILALMRILEITCKNKSREYNSMATIMRGLAYILEDLKDDFIKESYQIRIQELHSYINLYNYNNTDEARAHAEKIISLDYCATSTTNSYYIVGMSYLFNDYEKCLGNILRYRELLIATGRDKEAIAVDMNDIPFINNLWGKNQKLPETDDISEQAHYLALNGDKERSLTILDKVIGEKGINGFNLYYKGLATGDKTLFMQSLIYFVSKKGDKFYANLPYNQLKNDPQFKQMADLLLL